MSRIDLRRSLQYRLEIAGQKVAAPVMRSLPDGVQRALSNLALEVRIRRISARSSREFQLWRNQRDLKVNLGCGGDLKPGWLNLDLVLDTEPEVAEGLHFINYDLRRPLPLANGSCQIIYSSHFFEHLEYADAMRLLRQCYELLKPGGIFRISLPDFRGVCAAYLNGDPSYFELVDQKRFLPEVEPHDLTLIDFVNFAIYQSGEHKRMYDDEKVVRLLQGIGFNEVATCGFDEEIDPPSPLRVNYSFYVQAVK